MFCQHCGAEINDNAVICVKCGCAVNGANPKSNGVNNRWLLVAQRKKRVLMPEEGKRY